MCTDKSINGFINFLMVAACGYPQERIIAIVETEDLTVITTTGIHIARRIGEAVSMAYKGDMSFTYGVGKKMIRVLWRR